MSLNDRMIVAIAVGAAFVLILLRAIPWRREPAARSAFQTYEKQFTAYESGKHRRYELLFAVNGGAFALAKLFPEFAKLDPNKQSEPSAFLGRLCLDDLALGMIAFTLIMSCDIVVFGLVMRNIARRPEWTLWTGIFSLTGYLVLFVLCLLICTAWYLSQHALPPGGTIIIVGLLVVITVGYILQEIRAEKGDPAATWADGPT